MVILVNGLVHIRNQNICRDVAEPGVSALVSVTSLPTDLSRLVRLVRKIITCL